MNQPRATIRDVARVAGVSPAAVSKVLNDGYGVSAAMRERVGTAIEELEYRPITAARALRGRSHSLGVLADIRSSGAERIFTGIETESQDAALDLLISPIGDSLERQQRALDAMQNRSVDGLILVAPSVALGMLNSIGKTIPTVVIGRHGGGRHFDTVVDDDALGSALAIEHLIALGHKRIAHIGMPMGRLQRPSVLPQTARRDGYVAAMQEHLLEPVVVETSYTELGGYEGARILLARDEPPTAIFAGTDSVALGVLRAAHESGLRVPEDLSLVGADNTPIGSLPQIALTTIDPSGEFNGAAAVQLLKERMAGRDKPITYSIAPSLVVRGSSAALGR